MGARSRAAIAALFVVGGFATTNASAMGAVPHAVQPDESLWSIAAAQNLTTRTVASFNGLSEDAVVVVGQTVQIPTVAEGQAALGATATATIDPAPAQPAVTTTGAGHAVLAGQTLSGIAAANGVSASALAAANGRGADSFVYAGETLTIPAAAVAAPATGVSTGVSPTAGLGHVRSPYGELHLDPSAADSWNALRDESLRSYGQDLHPAGPVSAHRTYEQQAQLYQDYLNGLGPLAAPPGTSAHETGRAVDLETAEMRWVIDQIGSSFGWGQIEAPGEWWHINYAP